MVRAVAHLRDLGVRRISVGAALAEAAPFPRLNASFTEDVGRRPRAQVHPAARHVTRT